MKNRTVFISLAVMLVLSIGLISCGGDAVPEISEYNLTVSSTQGGSVTTPGEGTGSFTYDEGTVVNLVAEAEDGYRFVEWTGDVATIGNVNAVITIITTNDNYSITANFGLEYTPMVAAGWHHVIGLKSDGTVIAAGRNDFGQCDVGGWMDITKVAAGSHHTVGLKSDGTVVTVGDNTEGQCDVGNWMDIDQVSAGWYHTVGLEADGTVIAVGRNDYGQCEVGGWTDITQVDGGGLHTVGLKSDRSAVDVGLHDYGQCNIGGWMDIIQVAAGHFHTVGLEKDRTVIAVGAETELPTWNLI